MDVFSLRRSLDIDVPVGDDVESFRVELLRSRDRPERYRGRIWRLTMVRSVASFPRDDEDEPTDVFDADQFVGADDLLERDYSSFEAESLDDAEAQILRDLRQAVLALSWAQR